MYLLHFSLKQIQNCPKNICAQNIRSTHLEEYQGVIMSHLLISLKCTSYHTYGMCKQHYNIGL